MEEMHRTHKEPAWGWIGALMTQRPKTDRKPRPCPRGGVVTPWDRNAPCGWSA